MAQQLGNRPCGGRYGDIVQAIGNTPLVEVTRIDTGKCRLFLKLENQKITNPFLMSQLETFA